MEKPLTEKQEDALYKVRLHTHKYGSFNSTNERRAWPSLAPSAGTLKALVKRNLIVEVGGMDRAAKYYKTF